MPGKQVKNWKQYHGLRRRGMSKARAAAITNAASRKDRRRSRSRRRR
ncbi:hypothetical protein I5G60_gp73 [Mycobacterium phage Saguaro]|uniref:Uncharacterized protein n=1 Tax=Mycobacterium phage Saguaro TaxID=2315616 RepID=A0A386K9K2_9CAUD|nr:hypothetical protein I5G60_gp73 [Mycobacterium phage Saguaro]AYD82088.1 hypothetical protein SEA_SAGUARO_73 [Mycobacterium phage Saguaro]